VLRAQELHVGAAGGRRRSRGAERWITLRRAVAVGAIDLDRRGDLAVDVAVAVRVLGEMAIDAMETHVEVDRREVDALLELRRIVVAHDAPVAVEERALAVALEHRAEVPAVAVVVGEL